MDSVKKYKLIDFLDKHGCYPGWGSVQHLLNNVEKIGMSAAELEAAVMELERDGVVVTAGAGAIMSPIVPGVTFSNGVHHVKLCRRVVR